MIQKIGDINKTEIKTLNVLNLDYLIKKIENDLLFISGLNYRMYVKHYFTYLKHRFIRFFRLP